MCANYLRHCPRFHVIKETVNRTLLSLQVLGSKPSLIYLLQRTLDKPYNLLEYLS